MFLDTILKYSVKHFLLDIIENDRLTTGWPIPLTSISQELIMIETPNLKHIKQKSKANMIDYQFVSFDLLTYFYSNFTFYVSNNNC